MRYKSRFLAITVLICTMLLSGSCGGSRNQPDEETNAELELKQLNLHDYIHRQGASAASDTTS